LLSSIGKNKKNFISPTMPDHDERAPEPARVPAFRGAGLKNPAFG
jgi:hypothetical protein